MRAGRARARRPLDGLGGEVPAALSVYDAGFHEGVVGIVASRLKDRVHRPTFVFARGRDGALGLRGARSPAFTCATRWTS